MDLRDLINEQDPGMAVLQEWAARRDCNTHMFHPSDATLADQTLLFLQVTTRSILGAIVHGTGGLSIGGGLLRLWGSGPERSLLAANDAAARAAGTKLPDVLFVADDAFGGLFAVNGGRFGGAGHGEIFHLPVDALQWSSLDVGYADFVAWCLTGDLAMIYGPLFELLAPPVGAWPAIDRVQASYPPLWTAEGRHRPRSMREIDADESLRLRIELSGFDIE